MKKQASVIQVQNVSKKFSRSLKRSILYGLTDLGRNAIGLRAHSNTLRPQEFWAVNNISFDVHQGEVLGLIGTNGSGKSTTLKMLNGIYFPDQGSIRIEGRVGALIELGAGFHPMLTGRENIYVNGAILGMSRSEINASLDKIIDFSGIAPEFLDSPVKTYSSGMYARLGFSVAAHMKPQVLLIDEVLAVGDIAFQNRCYNRILEMKETATTIFVSHNLSSVSMICDRVIWLEKGIIRMMGTAEEVVAEYTKGYMQQTIDDAKNTQDENRTVSGELQILKIVLLDKEGNEKEVFEHGEEFTVRCYYEAFESLGKPYFQIDIGSPRYGSVFSASMVADGRDRPEIYPGKGVLECHFGPLPLQAGVYSIDINVRPASGMGKLYRQLLAAQFTVNSITDKQEFTGRLATFRELNAGPVFVPYEWQHANQPSIERTDA